MRDIKFFTAGTITLIFEALYWVVIGALLIIPILLTMPFWYTLQKIRQCRKPCCKPIR